MRSHGGTLPLGRRLSVALIGLALAAIVACTPQPPLNADSPSQPVDPPDLPIDESAIRLNQIQMIGSHNSYHIAPSEQILGLLEFFAGAVPDIASALGNPELLNYTHPDLTTQLQRGLRTFELDVFADSTGGRFSYPLLPELLGLGGPRPSGISGPGMKVLHIQDIDFISTCPTLIDCLSEMREWSDANPKHLPIIINIELKDDELPEPFNGTQIEPFDGANLDAVDGEIRSVLGDRLITPDDVRGTHSDLRTAITTDGWPSLAESRQIPVLHGQRQ
ncbi:MAG: Ca2+-dependent phosphoinositide-specific phospholipase C [Microthrixaceae bacterium]